MVQIVFQNEHFVVADKPGGWLSVPGRTGAADARPCLGKKLEEQLGCRLWPVHRLDSEVSGLIIFAKNSDAHKEACDWFESRAVAKTYEAWSEPQTGALAFQTEREHEWTSKLLRGKKRAYESPHGKTAVTLAFCRGSMKTAAGVDACAWVLKPQTGRAHQLRYELFRHGHPIVGDTLYGATSAFVPQTIALRAVALDLSAVPAEKLMGLPAKLTVKDLASVQADGGVPS